MCNLPECANLIAILQNLVVIEPDTKHFSATWQCLEKLTDRAILNAETLNPSDSFEIEPNHKSVGTDFAPFSNAAVQTERAAEKLESVEICHKCKNSISGQSYMISDSLTTDLSPNTRNPNVPQAPPLPPGMARAPPAPPPPPLPPAPTPS